MCNLCRSDYVNAPKVTVKVLAKIPVKLLRDEDARETFWREFEDALLAFDEQLDGESLIRVYRQTARQVSLPAAVATLTGRPAGWASLGLAALVEKSSDEASGK